MNLSPNIHSLTQLVSLAWDETAVRGLGWPICTPSLSMANYKAQGSRRALVMSTLGGQWPTLWPVPGEILPLGSNHTEPFLKGLPNAGFDLLPLPQARPPVSA